MANARRIALGCIGTALTPLLRQRATRFKPGAVTGRCQGIVAEELSRIVAELAQHGDGHRAMTQAADIVRRGVANGAFDQWFSRTVTQRDKLTLCEASDAFSGRRWKLQMFFIPENESHSPHSHSDVASALIVGRGTIRAREYDRYRELEAGGNQVMLALASDGLLNPGDALISTREHRDVHWFGATGGPAVAFNFQAVGFSSGIAPFAPLRIYVDARRVAPGEINPAPRLSRRAARALFARQPLAAFPLPQTSS